MRTNQIRAFGHNPFKVRGLVTIRPGAGKIISYPNHHADETSGVSGGGVASLD